METVEILGVPVACLEMAGLISTVLEWSREGAGRSVFYANAHCLNLAWEDAHYRRILQQADLVYADGVSLVWGSRLLGGCSLHKMTGADWIRPFCATAQERGASLYLLGGQPGVAKQAAENMRQAFPLLEIGGTADGFFAAKTSEQVRQEIFSLRPAIVLVGLGVPRQENWIMENRQRLEVGVWWGVGALFDFVARVEHRAPDWMLRLGLEWLWRLGQDPAGKWQRYLIGNPLFLYRLVRQKRMLDDTGRRH